MPWKRPLKTEIEGNWKQSVVRERVLGRENWSSEGERGERELGSA